MQSNVWAAETQPWLIDAAFPLEYVQLDDGVDLGRLGLAALPGELPTLADWIEAMLDVLGSAQGTLLDGCSFVARSRAGLLGASIVLLRDGAPWLTHLLVRPEHQRQGLGTALLAATFTALERARYPVLYAQPVGAAGSAFLSRRHFRPAPDFPA